MMCFAFVLPDLKVSGFPCVKVVALLFKPEIRIFMCKVA